MPKKGKKHHNFRDLTNQQFNRLLVLKNFRNIKGYVEWQCLCDCYKTIWVKSDRLIRNITKSCGCFARDIHSKSCSKINKKYNIVDYIGKKYDRLTILDSTDFRNSYVSCLCLCGNICTKKLCDIINMRVRSCGCLKREIYEKNKNVIFKKQNIIISRNTLSKRIKSNISSFLYKLKLNNKYICNICNSENYIVLHHLFSKNNNPELSKNINNIIPLCIKCHAGFHNSYGYGMNTPLQYLEYKKILFDLEYSFNNYIPQTKFSWR